MFDPRRSTLRFICSASAFFVSLAAGQVHASAPPDPLARDIFKQLIEINTTDSVGTHRRGHRPCRSAFSMRAFAPKDVQVLLGPNPQAATSWCAFTATARGSQC